MRSASPVSRPAWVGAVNALTGTGGESRKSPVEIFATAASVVTRTHYAEVTGIKHVAAEDQVLLITEQGKIIRVACSTIRSIGRSTCPPSPPRRAQRDPSSPGSLGSWCVPP